MMKKNISIFMLVIIMMSSISLVSAKDKVFNGKITFKISIDSDAIPEQAKAMLPKTMVLYVGKSKTRSDLYTQMGNQSSIEDLNAKTKVGLIDVMGQKYAINESYEDMQKEIEALPEIDLEITNETKQIAGYTCKKVVATVKEDGSVHATAWITEELAVHENANFSNPVFAAIEGMMLQFEVDAGNGMVLTFTASEVEKKKIKDKTFEVPADYKVVTQDELESIFGG